MARFCEVPYTSTQEDKKDGEHVGQPKQVAFGKRGTKGNFGYGRESSLGGLQVSGSNKAQKVTSERRTPETQAPEGGRSYKKQEGKSQLNCHVVQGVSVDDGEVGVTSPGELYPLQLGVNGANKKCKSNSPPRRCKKKGLSDGDQEEEENEVEVEDAQRHISSSSFCTFNCYIVLRIHPVVHRPNTLLLQ